MKHREQKAASSAFSEARLDANTRQHVLNNLKVFTLYELKLAAVNDKGPGPYTPLYSATTGEKRKFNVSSRSFKLAKVSNAVAALCNRRFSNGDVMGTYML